MVRHSIHDLNLTMSEFVDKHGT